MKHMLTKASFVTPSVPSVSKAKTNRAFDRATSVLRCVDSQYNIDNRPTHRSRYSRSLRTNMRCINRISYSNRGQCHSFYSLRGTTRRASAGSSLSSALGAVATERTYVMVKPDGVHRGLVGEIISRFEKKGFTVTGLKMFRAPKTLAQEHYKDLSSKPFYNDLVDYIISGPVVCIVLEGKGVVASARKLIGATNPLEAETGTIRGDFAVEVGRNVVHGSDSIENGEREIALWFADGAGMDEWMPHMIPWIRELERVN